MTKYCVYLNDKVIYSTDFWIYALSFVTGYRQIFPDHKVQIRLCYV